MPISSGAAGGTPGFVGAVVYRSSGSVAGVQTYDTALKNAQAIWAAGAPSRFTIPAGYTNALWLLTANGRSATAPNPNDLEMYFQKNGALTGGFLSENWSAGGHNVSASGSLIVLGSAGDYFEARFDSNSGVSIAGGAFPGANCPLFAITLLGA